MYVSFYSSSAEVADLLRRDPEFVVGMLRKLRTLKPVEK